MENQEGRYLYKLDDQNLPRMSYIKTGGQTSDGKWIVVSGVNIGDKIVTNGIQKVIPGRPIKIINEEQKAQENIKKRKLY
jgi:membrane fusion protein (multidrug efflux system)